MVPARSEYRDMYMQGVTSVVTSPVQLVSFARQGEWIARPLFGIGGHDVHVTARLYSAMYRCMVCTDLPTNETVR